MPELSSADSLMITSPDSALALLESLPSPEEMRKTDYAYYCLLLTEARDKTYYPFTSDSVIRVAADYLLDNGSDHLKARTYYISGRVYHELMRYERAQENYLQAIPLARKENNYSLLLRIHNQCGDLYRNRKLYDRALSFLHEALLYCELANEKKLLPYCLRDIGRVHMFTESTDSTLYYYNKAIESARLNEDKYAESVIYKELGVAYKGAGRYREAIEAVKSALGDRAETEDLSTCLSLGSLYLNVNKPDSAAYFLKLAKNSANPYTSSGANYYLYKLAVQMADFEEAVYYNELYTEQRDSLDSLADKDELQNLAHRFEQEELKNRMQLAHSRTKQNNLIALLILTAISGSIMILYYRYRFRKEQEFAEQQAALRNEKRMRIQGEELIQKNKIQIETNRRLINEKESQLATIQKKYLTQETALLEKENQLLCLKEEKRALSDSFFAQTRYKERILMVGSACKLNEFHELIPFSMKEINDLAEALNSLYDNFTVRLQKDYPLLKERDIIMLCLIKAGAKTCHLSELICMTPNAVTKKKAQILKKMCFDSRFTNLAGFLAEF